MGRPEDRTAAAVGKRDEEGRDLLPFHGEFESDIIARALHARLSRKTKLESAEAWIKRLDEIHSRNALTSLTRTAWYCSGCPHSTSTKAPEGSVVSAGIGCHTMAMWMDRGVVMGTHMGAEGAQWIGGMQPFTNTEHIFQNMGDGTYAHSGSLAVRYCAATDANITFKILVNSHTSMTGGQEIMGAEPVHTEFGRKTRIDQPSCNKDYSCVKGFCPSFLTITPNPAPDAAAGGKKKKKGRLPALDRALPDPVFKVDPNNFGAHVMGIGGTGSVTVAATIANAARLDGKWALGLDQTGLAQKGGTVISDIKITATQFDGSNKISDGSTDLYLGLDILNATDNKNLEKCHPERTIAIVSSGQTPTGHMVSDKAVQFPDVDCLVQGIDRVTRSKDNVYLDAQTLAEGLFGDSMATNMFMVGVAFQAGALPISAASIETAIRQAGVGVDMSLLAFKWGRMAVLDLDFVKAEIHKYDAKAPKQTELTPEARQIVESVGATGEVRRLLDTLCAKLSGDNLSIAVKLASIPDDIRGYGHVKERHAALAKAKQAQLMTDFNDPQAAKARGAAQVVQFV